MLEIPIPGSTTLHLRHLVLDFNGTLALDGELLPGVGDAIAGLAEQFSIHVLTADTTGRAVDALRGFPCRVATLPAGEQDLAKRRFVEALGAADCACIGNGRNDALMLAAGGLGIAVVQAEGACLQAVLAARVVAPSIDAALGLLLRPSRLAATLRT